MTHAISCPLWSSVYECQRVHSHLRWGLSDVCVVSRMYINVCNCDMFSVVNVYHDHLKFCGVCIDGRRYVCCSECNVVSNKCNEPTLCNLSACTVVKLCTLGVSLVF